MTRKHQPKHQPKHRASHRHPAVLPAHVVRAAIARAVLGQHTPANATLDTPVLGDITLLPHQRDAVARLRAILHREHVALLADDVGTGKTFTALGVARSYARTLVITPAALVPMWHDAITRTHSANIEVRSMQRFSRLSTGDPECAWDMKADGTTPDLVIIDEAHHFRTPSTRRYRAVAIACAGRDLLLLSATPVHNAATDLRAVFALALGEGADLHAITVGRLIVRRRSVETRRPTVSVQPPIQVPHDPRLLDLILALPAPLPAQDGAVAGALIRLGLLRAWCSSDAALAATVRRRLLRGEALLHALHAGRHPNSAELRSWLVGEHEVQLAFPELLANHAVESGPLLEVLDRHLKALGGLLEAQRRDHRADAARVAALRKIMHDHPHAPVVAFSQFAETVRAVSRALTDIAGVGALTGRHGWIASGPISRADTLAHFAPVAQGRPPPPAHQRIRLLLTTDLLAEGVNLQDAGVVVHLDLPWTDALRQQRVGRCARVGAPHDVVTVYTMQPPETAEVVLKLAARLARKARISTRLVGNISAVEQAERLREAMKGWQNELGGRDAEGRELLIAGVPSPQPGFLAVCRSVDGTREVIGGEQVLTAGGRARWRMSRAPGALLRLARSVTGSAPAPAAQIRECWPRVSRALEWWIERESVSGEIGDRDPSASSAHQAARRRLQEWLRRVPPSQRALARARIQDAQLMLLHARGAGAESAVEAWVASFPRGGASAPEWRNWPERWRAYPVLVRSGTGSRVSQMDHAWLQAAGASHSGEPLVQAAALRIEYVLLLI